MTPYYSDSHVTIYHGDAMDVLPTVRGAAGFVTDPPYIAAGGSSRGRHTTASDGQFFGFWLGSVATLLIESTRSTGAGFVFCDWRVVSLVVDAFTPAPDLNEAPDWRFRQALVWLRGGLGMGKPFRGGFEMVGFTSGPNWDGSHMPTDQPAVLDYYWPYGRRTDHPAEKPVNLCEDLISWIGGDGPILDPFAGGGATLLAARNQGRKAIGIELEERYCEIAAERCSQGVLDLEAS